MKIFSSFVIGVVTLSLVQTSSTMPPNGSTSLLKADRAAPTRSQHIELNGSLVLAKLSPSLIRAPQPRALSLADRVGYQRAIEEVYWRHRIWPKERRGPKPSLDEVMPPEQVEKKVEDYLRNSQALEDYWKEPLSAEQLQAEIERMAQHTKQPEVLRELFETLGNDPFVIVECLARPALSERLLTNLYANDQRFQSELGQSSRARAELKMPKIMAAASGNYKVPPISDGADGCTDDTWTATSTGDAPAGRIDHTAVWTGSEMIVWGGTSGPGAFVGTGGRYNPSTDSWIATSMANAPAARSQHTAIWTGTEMIVWGGQGGNSFPYLSMNTGGRYNPVTDSWAATAATNAPSGRTYHTVVWTGSEMIVWGGTGGGPPYLNTGGRYNPSTDSWIATGTTNAPSGRTYHTAVWTGSEMIVWGGQFSDGILNTGGKYDPSTDTWTSVSTTNAPAARYLHTAVFTGNEMIVWGGAVAYYSYLNTGSRYDPGTDSWQATSTAYAAAARAYHKAVWTGSEMIVWGGGRSNTGGRYNPARDNWTATSTVNAPNPPGGPWLCTAVWTGGEMIVWGGLDTTYLNTGGRYCVQPSAPKAQGAFSRQTHGAAGTFDIPLPLVDSIGIESRSGGTTRDYQMIIDFTDPVMVGSASMTAGTGNVSSFSVSDSEVIVNLTGVSNVQRITVTLLNVTDGTYMRDVPVSMAVLVGDVTGNGTVNATDVSYAKRFLGQVVDDSNFRQDVNNNGSINAADLALIKANVGSSVPP